MKKSILAFLFTSLLTGNLHAAPSARDIIQKVIDQDNGKSQYSVSTVATCRYQVTNKKMSCAEQPRVKVIEGVQKDFGKNNKDSRSISIILEPAAEKGIGFLQFDYDDPNRDTDQWMYLSAMGKVKRLVSGKSDEPKTGTLFGSEISYEDVERPHIDDYLYKIIKEENYRGRPCWVIESQPTPERARKTNYSRGVQWIDKEYFQMVKAQLYDRGGRPIKEVIASDIEKIDGIWIARRLNVNNVQSRRISTMKTDKIRLNIKVDDRLFSQRTLTDGAWREQQLQVLRKGL